MTIFEAGTGQNELKGEEWWQRFQGLLDDQNTWPSEYLFKFIVPRSSQPLLEAIFGESPIKVRASSKGKYVSVTASIMMESSDAVIEVYRKAGKIPGVVSL